jgi:hypothetical protein
LRRQSLTSADGGTVLVHPDRRVVLFGEDGRSLWDVSASGEPSLLALGEDGVLRIHAGDAVEELGGPGDELVVEPGATVLRRADGTVVWREGVQVEEAADDYGHVLETASEQDVELLCRTAGVRPTVADVTGPARIAIIW